MRVTYPYEVFLRPKWKRIQGDYVTTIWAVSSMAAAYQWRKHRIAPDGCVYVFRRQREMI